MVTYHESGFSPHFDLQLKGTLDLQIDPMTNVATFANVNVTLTGLAPLHVDDEWFRSLLEHQGPDLLTIEVVGNRVLLSGGYTSASCGPGMFMEAVIQPLSIPEPSTVVLSSCGLMALGIFTRMKRP